MKGTLIVASMMDEETINRIEDKFAGSLGTQVTLAVRVDPQILGGFIVDINHRQYDYSVRNQLRQVRDHLMGL